MKLKPYKEYKEIELSWLEKIPSHWEIKRGKVIYERENRPINVDDEVVTCFRDGEVTLRKNRRTEGFTESIQEIGYQGVRAGDLVIHQMDAFAGAVGVSDSDGKSTPVYSVCNGLLDVNNHYYAFIIREMAINGYIKSLSRGIRERSTDFRFTTFGREYYPLPPKEEQDKIVDFLDDKLEKIDTFIDLKTRLIELLKEQKQAMINKAVTKGLDDYVKMKGSGIEWLGEVPEEWKLVRLKNLIEYMIGGTWGEEVVEGSSDNIYCIRVADYDMTKLDVSDEKLTIRNISVANNKHRILQRGDILIEKSGGGANQPVGRVILFDKDFVAVNSNFITRLSPNRNVVSSDFLLFLMHNIQSRRLHMQYIYQTTGIQNLNVNNYLSMNVYVPHIKIQKEIVEYIQRESKKLDQTIRLYEKEIGLIKEYRTSLISSAVTGKIDVRNM